LEPLEGTHGNDNDNTKVCKSVGKNEIFTF
jgi:hypothetical protein